MAKNNYSYFLKEFQGQLPVGECFDLMDRLITIGGRSGHIYFVDGLTDGDKLQRLLNFLLSIGDESMLPIDSAQEFIEQKFPFIDCSVTDDIDLSVKQLYSGLIVIVVDGLDKVVIADTRAYPSRGIAEPQKEKSLRGAKDGFTENFMANVGLIRRRIRDNRLIFKIYIVGEKTKTDVSMVYMKGIADEKLVDQIHKQLTDLSVDTLTVGDQSLVESLLRIASGKKKSSRFNPFPRVRYTQRPDVIAAHITEGKIAIIVDNSPSVILLPVGIFDFMQDVDDYYFPIVTGNYFRFLRIMNSVVILLLSPLYLLIIEGYIPAPMNMDFLIPTDEYAIPIFWQFILLEISIDGLKLASLNTPESLGMSLSVIGALILGQFSVDSGWFIPQTILVMAVVALASFTEPSIELSYGIKFMRILLLIGSYFFGYWGALVGLVLILIITATTRTISGYSYLYPLFPFKWRALKKLLCRTSQ